MRAYGIGGWRRDISRRGLLNREQQSCEQERDGETLAVPRTVSPHREIVLYSKSHAYLISQNYGSSCSSFNGSSVATWSSVSRFFKYASWHTRRVNIARARQLFAEKDYNCFFFSFSFAKNALRKKREKRYREIPSNSRAFYYENLVVSRQIFRFLNSAKTINVS